MVELGCLLSSHQKYLYHPNKMLSYLFLKNLQQWGLHTCPSHTTAAHNYPLQSSQQGKHDKQQRPYKANTRSSSRCCISTSHHTSLLLFLTTMVGVLP